jgi:hypothetical protein
MLSPVILIVMTMLVLGALLWVAQGYRLLRYARGQIQDAWLELRTALLERREMIPYIVAAVPTRVASVLDVLGNACDLAANVEGVPECSQAEGRLSAAINRVFAQLDTGAPGEDVDLLASLRERVKVQEMRIELLKGVYNRQVELFNALQRRGAGRVLTSLGVVRYAEVF